MKTILLIIFLKNNDLEIYRIYMTIFFLAYFGVVIGMRSIMLYKETKVDATKDFGKNSETKKAERIIQFALLIMIVIAANYILILENYKYLFPFKELEIGWLQTTGFVMSLIGLVFTFIAQIQMKNSWRLGIDKNEDVELITKGLFTLSRNPIYLGLGVSFVGFFFIAPNVLSIIFLLVMFYGVSLKIDDEEEFLLNKFGKSYESYKSRVSKWV